MRKTLTIILIFFSIAFASPSFAQCSVCTKTVSQMGEKPAQGLNTAILYLMLAPFAIVGFIGFRWWKHNKNVEDTAEQ